MSAIENPLEKITISYEITRAQRATLDALADHTGVYTRFDHGQNTQNLLVYIGDDDKSVDLYNIRPDGSYTYETLIDGFNNGWYCFNEEGREVSIDEDGNAVLEPGGRTDERFYDGE